MKDVTTQAAPVEIVPFYLPATLRDGMRHGTGVLRTITVAALTDVTIIHNLGRIPHFVIVLDNGTAFAPRVKRSTVTAWTAINVTVQFDVATAGAFAWVV